jgi:predicted solute-binding protein
MHSVEYEQLPTPMGVEIISKTIERRVETEEECGRFAQKNGKQEDGKLIQTSMTRGTVMKKKHETQRKACKLRQHER